jgi:hypothetical protein
VALNATVEPQGLADSVRTALIGPLLGGKGTLRHLGFVVASISGIAEGFAVAMSARWDGQIVHDPLQRVRVAFFSPYPESSLELVEPASEDSPVSEFLKKRIGLHHVCYEIDDLELGLCEARGCGLGDHV